MSAEDLEPADPELRALFAAEARFPDDTPAMRARVWQRVHAAVAMPPAPQPLVGAGLRHVLVAAAAFAGGVGTGVAITLAFVDDAPAPVEAVPPPDAPPPVAPRARRSVEAPASDLAREQAIIDAARAALARGRPEGAFEPLERHSRDFAEGKLVEEREALRVLAHARAGRREEARAQAERFRRRFPESLLLPAIDDAVAGDP